MATLAVREGQANVGRAGHLISVQHGVRYQVKSCRHESATLVCELGVTSSNSVVYRALWYPAKSFAVDQSGNRIEASSIRADTVPLSDSELSLPGQHTIMVVQFDQAPKAAANLSGLEIVGDDGSPVTLRFSNVEISPK